jgi:hypothetical protein
MHHREVLSSSKGSFTWRVASVFLPVVTVILDVHGCTGKGSRVLSALMETSGTRRLKESSNWDEGTAESVRADLLYAASAGMYVQMCSVQG